MSADETRRIGELIAAHHALTFNADNPRGSLGKLIEQLTPTIASRYLGELRRRKRAGETLVSGVL